MSKDIKQKACTYIYTLYLYLFSLISYTLYNSWINLKNNLPKESKE